MTRTRKRRFVPTAATALEPRCLLSGTPVAVWIGQDGHDLAGGPTAGVGNGIEDVHVVLSNLPSNDPISKIQMLGYGAGEWDYNINAYSQYGGVVQQAAGATTAAYFFDVYQNETGRSFTLTLTYADQTTAVINMNGGTASTTLHMPYNTVTSVWHGQDGQDLTGQSVSVGPDGFQDAHISLGNLDATATITALTVTDTLGDSWGALTNPGASYRAEFVRGTTDPMQGDVYFSPNRDLNGLTFTVSVQYDSGKLDHATLIAGHTDPNLSMPAQAPVNLNWNALSTQWLGQDGLNLLGPGDVHLSLGGLPAGRSVVAATLSDQSGIDWTYDRPGSGQVSPDPAALALGFRAGTSSGTADLTFQPIVNETGSTLTLLVTLDNGSILATHLAGGACDPGLREPGIASTFVLAHPGDDLNALANSYGTVRLVAGLYPMDQPLVLNHPVTITADPGATILFSQGPNDPTWTAGIKVRASHTTLNGFQVRFAGPIRWTPNISYGPAVIGWSDNFDTWSNDPGIDLAFTNLDIQAPTASTSWEEAPRSFRLVGAESGQVANNLIKGGTTELTGGPWQVTGNAVIGTVTDTFSYCAFGTHSTRDLTLMGNLVEPMGPSGKIWRFLVMTQGGVGDLVANNTTVGVGPMDSDTMPSPNASEVILTEAYTVHFEGMVSSVSADGLTVQIPTPQGGQARTGDLVAILSGPQAGQWRTIAQVLGPTTYVLDAPVLPFRFAASLDVGFSNETFQGNTIDCRGSSAAGDLVLVGNQFGLKVLNNTFLGGNYAFKITASPSEAPVTWGWTHAPLLGATITGNTFQDSIHGGTLDVEHNAYATSDAGRVYFSGVFSNNTGTWTAPFLAAQAAAGNTAPPTLVTVGDSLSADPGELVLSATGNQVSGPGSVLSSQTFQVVSATDNGQSVRNTGYVLPAVGVVSSASTALTPKVAGTVALPTPTPTPTPTPKPIVAVVAKPIVPVVAKPIVPVVPAKKSPIATPARKPAAPTKVVAAPHPVGPKAVARTVTAVTQASPSSKSSVNVLYGLPGTSGLVAGGGTPLPGWLLSVR